MLSCSKVRSPGLTAPLTAVDMVSVAAETYNYRALIRMGDCYAHGMGVEKDPRKAFGCYQRGAELIGRGKVPLAGCCLDGKGTDVDVKKAFELYTLAADVGDLESLFVLANMYHDGQGTEADDSIVAKLFVSSSRCVGNL